MRFRPASSEARRRRAVLRPPLKAAREGRTVPPVRLLGGIVGVVCGFALGILFTEVIFPNGASWPDVVPFALAVAGWPLGTGATEWLHHRRDAHVPHAR